MTQIWRKDTDCYLRKTAGSAPSAPLRYALSEGTVVLFLTGMMIHMTR